ncbi:MAG: hypothetical protein RL557_418 [archaeon]|jgi:hypothetical protein
MALDLITGMKISLGTMRDYCNQTTLEEAIPSEEAVEDAVNFADSYARNLSPSDPLTQEYSFLRREVELTLEALY